jgi:hypothetical protein
MIVARPSPLSAIEAMTEPAELARAQAHRQQFGRNWAWLKDHATEIFRRHRGQYVVVAAEQKFVGATAEEAWTRAAEAQAEERGSFVMQVPKQGSGMRNLPPVLMVTDVTNPDDLARVDSQNTQFGRNLSWFQEHVDEISALYRGRWICIAGQEVFAADTAREAIALAHAAHPQDVGHFTYRVPTKRAARIYAH